MEIFFSLLFGFVSVIRKKKGGRKFMTRDLSVLRNNNNSPVCVWNERETTSHQLSRAKKIFSSNFGVWLLFSPSQ